MSAKLLLRIALVLLGAIALWGALAVARRSRQDRPATLRLPAIDSTTVSRIDIRKGGDSVVLMKTGATWSVNGFTAAPGTLAEFFGALSDSVAPSELAARSPVLHQRLGVDSSGRTLHLQTGDSTLAVLLIGNRGPDFDGFYVRRADQSEVYLVHARWPELAARPVDDWRDKQIAKIAPDSIAGIEITHGARHFALARQEGWRFVGSGAAPDSTATGRLVSAFGDLRAAGFPARSQADSLRGAKPWRRVRVSSATGASLLSLVIDSTAAGFWLQADSGGQVYRIDRFEADAIAPAESILIKKRQE